MCLKNIQSFYKKNNFKAMANIGSIPIDINGNLDSGIALLLIKPPKNPHEISHKGFTLRIKSNSPYCVCMFNNAKTHNEVLTQGIPAVQECLDLLSMTGKEDLATRDYTDEYFVWWQDGGKRVFSYVSTITLKISSSTPTLTITDKNGHIISPQTITPNYSVSFRYYRLAQISDDLFDSFRNMYLAFELLLSSVYPKNRGKEIDWLKNSLKSSKALLQLESIVPNGTPSSVDYIIDTIYLNARLPLFHSKYGKTILIPSNLNDRITISKALYLLTKIVIQMADKWYSCRRISGWANLMYFEEGYEKILTNSNFVYSDNPKHKVDDILKSKSIKKGVKFKSQYNYTFINDNRPNIYGQLDISSLKNKGPLFALFVTSGDKVLLLSSPESYINLQGFDILETIIFLRGNNASQPRSLFSR